MATESQLLALVRQFAKDRGIDPELIVPDAQLSDLGVDSMHMVDLIFRFEETFDIQIRIEDFRPSTVGEAIAFVSKLIPTTPKPPAT